jgi:hypothetical protein
MSRCARSRSRSAKYGPARTELRTTRRRRPPRPDWGLAGARVPLWPPTTHPPHRDTDEWGAGSRRPVETGCCGVAAAGRTAAGLEGSEK